MYQLKMLKLMDEVKPYPVAEGYYIRNIRMLESGVEDPAEIDAWAEVSRNQMIGEEADGRHCYKRSITDTTLLNPATDVFFVCEKETDRPVATLTAHLGEEEGEGWIHMVGSLAEVRGKKLGHAMLARGLERLAEAKVTKVRLTTDDWRRPAIKTYLTAGFKPVIFDDPHEDAIPHNERWDLILNEMGWEDRTYLTLDGKIWTK